MSENRRGDFFNSLYIHGGMILTERLVDDHFFSVSCVLDELSLWTSTIMQAIIEAKVMNCFSWHHCSHHCLLYDWHTTVSRKNSHVETLHVVCEISNDP